MSPNMQSGIRAIILSGFLTLGAAGQQATAPASTTQPVVMPGTVEAFESVDQYAKTSGYLLEVKADIGDHVKAGDVLAVIDDPELAQTLIAAKAAAETKRQMLQAADAAVRQMQAGIEVARQQLAMMQVEQRLMDITLKRQTELFAGKAVTDQQLDEVKAKAETATAQNAVAAAKLAAAEADLQAAQANRGVAAAQVEVAAAEVERINALLKYTSIVAPFDGVITRRWVNRGDLAQSAVVGRTTPLFTCQRIDLVRVFCEVPETSAARIQAGDAADIRVSSFGAETLHGKVTRIATAIDPQSRTMKAEIDLPNPGERLRPGMYAQITLMPAAERVAATPR